MQAKLSRWAMNWLCLFLSVQFGVAQAPTMMTREQAGQIAFQFAQAGQYPGTLHWLTVDSLPAQQEVPEWDHDLINQLAAQGDNWNVTMGDELSSWFGTGLVYGDVYYFLVTFNQYPERRRVAKVNAWTGYCEEGFRGYRGDDYETNEDLGLGNYPVKTFEELQNIALNIAQKLLGEGSYDILTVPYTPDKQQVLADMGWGFIIFKVAPKTRAHLPQMVELWINSRTGYLEQGKLWNRPVAVSTTPLISKDKAKRLAEQYLSGLGIIVDSWLDDGFYGGEIIHKVAFPYYAVVGLYVIEDELLEQHLIWSLIFTWTKDNGSPSCGWVSVDALAGYVKLFSSQNLDLSSERRRGSCKRPDMFECYELYLNGKWVDLGEPLLHVNGRIFINIGYADNLGAHWDGNKLRGKRGEFFIGTKEGLHYFGKLYIPLRRICEISGIRLWWDNERKVLILMAEWLEPRKLLAQRR